jgi:hypothetical protein
MSAGVRANAPGRGMQGTRASTECLPAFEARAQASASRLPAPGGSAQAFDACVQASEAWVGARARDRGACAPRARLVASRAK